MSGNDSERWKSNSADWYDKLAGFMVPRYHQLQDEVIALMLADRKPGLVVDLGGGSGIFLEKVLASSPKTRGAWVDSSPDFFRVASRRLERFGDRATYIQRSFLEDWASELPQRPDAICSMSAIHHLDSAGKKKLYGDCFKTLSAGGWLYNIDEMSTLHDDAYRRTLEYWVSHVDRTMPEIPLKLEPYARQWVAKFDGWKKRNMQNIGQPKQAGDDIHECFVSQMQWLAEIGFVKVDLFMKFQLWSVIGGQKPQ